MMKFITTVCLLAMTQIGLAKQIEEEAVPTILFEETVKDPLLKANESKFVFFFRNIEFDHIDIKFQYSIDGIAAETKLGQDRMLEIMTTPGIHSFQFYYNYEYYEVYTGELSIAEGFKSEYSVYFEIAEMRTITEKPVIYLYPQKETEVSVKLDVKGKTTFTYPEYNEGWNFTASPNGNLTFGEKEYNYLFWESSQRIVLPSNHYMNGYCVAGGDAITFLKDKLTQAGLTSKEQADFITYWGPRLAQNENNFVRFVFNESCDQYAELDINPKPDNIYRIYILWQPVKEKFIDSEQIIPTMNREGFTVLEWGGQQLNANNHLNTSSR